MTRAFIITLNLPDGTDPQTVVQELTSDLDDFDIVAIHPWASPTTAGMPLPNPSGSIKP